MNDLLRAVLQALALVVVIEGLAYALFPGGLKRIMGRAIDTPDDILRLTGVAALALGVAGIWLIRG